MSGTRTRETEAEGRGLFVRGVFACVCFLIRAKFAQDEISEFPVDTLTVRDDRPSVPLGNTPTPPPEASPVPPSPPRPRNQVPCASVASWSVRLTRVESTKHHGSRFVHIIDFIRNLFLLWPNMFPTVWQPTLCPLDAQGHPGCGVPAGLL